MKNKRIKIKKHDEYKYNPDCNLVCTKCDKFTNELIFGLCLDCNDIEVEVV